MQQITLNLESRFFRIVRWLSGKSKGWYTGQDWDTCSLTNHVLYVTVRGVLGLMCLVAVALFVAFIVAFLVAAVGGAATHLYNGYDLNTAVWWHWPLLFILGCAVIAAVLGAVVGVFIACLQTAKYLRKEVVYREPTQIGTLYRSWKDKTCSKVKFK